MFISITTIAWVPEDAGTLDWRGGGAEMRRPCITEAETKFAAGRKPLAEPGSPAPTTGWATLSGAGPLAFEGLERCPLAVRVGLVESGPGAE